ncbi:MAG: DegT/DnrJ/EryC1/StrS family aminotransferase [Candidatus Krumholzibacteria bacterium]|nr:DegT/DnrJ/EryC1/StrS family aminotransferase [Candidatus Krumholzibacteria bacterium]MDP6669927.1 DegT/DnrJ/EryC1/StrS family aminotransferase [Candidatus Krumholzibacteria bacterium]MDP6797351.1 DegT/DnrJ/EryC1/StrS family aminotransferase [Candidatus Krumholzibacteria bacterium]MDP7020839.1 DegT/DnrJ/EryC1/StrS family aminotransferase [Candidatus Krumholzibacteria bacterium]
MSVPFLDLRIQYKALREELLPGIETIMANAAFVGGPALREFEESFANYCDASHVVGVGNGTDALHLAIRAAGIGPGDEVITAANTFVATVEAIVLAGATPVLVDMERETYHLDLQQVEDRIGPSTRAIIPVHLYGDPVDMDPVIELCGRHNLILIEDAAQAHGARYKGRPCGSMGDLAGFSFYPGKNLGAYGDGGAVATSSEEMAARVRAIGDHGSAKKYSHEMLGTNSRLDAIQAHILTVKLRHLDDWNRSRRAHAASYREGLAGLDWLTLPLIREGHEPVFHLYIVRTERREKLERVLKSAEIAYGFHYPVPVHLQPAFLELGKGKGSFPEAESAASEILSLPMFPELKEDQIEQVCEALRSVD